MVKKIGNLFFKHSLFLLICSLFICLNGSPIKLSVTDTYGKPLQQVGLGVPFLIDVEVNANSRQKPRISNEHFVIQEQGAGQYTTIINGRSQVKQQHRYIAKAKNMGTFELGPASIELNGIIEESNVLTIAVGDRPIVQQHAQEEEPVQVQLFSDKSQAVVGEKIIIKLRIYFIEPININNLLAPDIADVYMYDAGKPKTGLQKIHDKQYEYIEHGLEIYPQKPGQLHIPSATVLCSIAVKPDRQGDFFGSMFTMLGITREQRFYSNGLTIAIEPLPPYEKKVNAVGQFTSYQATLDHNKAKEGEGVVLTISLEGDGDLEHIDWPEVKLPEGLRAYESKNYLVSEHSKKFEYIIQGEKNGMYIIPEQSFIYFNPEAKQFSSLNTNSISLKILDSDKKIEKVESSQNVTQQQSEKQRGNEIGYSLVIREDYFIPIKLFLWLLLLPFLYPLFYGLYIAHKRFYENRNGKKKSFQQAYRLLSDIENNKTTLTLYDIFCNLFVKNGAISHAEISEDRIESYLKSKKMNIETLQQWNQFFKSLAEQKFYSKSTDNKPLIKQSYKWIHVLEDII